MKKPRHLDLLDKDFNCLRMLKELKEDIEKDRKQCINKIRISIERNYKRNQKFCKVP